jgi:pimeloyl-ACP methyl ester carboxylesterase
LRRLRRVLQITAAVVVVLVGALAITGVIFGSWSRAQLDAVVVLSITEKTPVLAWAVRVVTDEPRVEEATVGGQPTVVAKPADDDGPWPTVVFVNGATREGRHHPKVQRLARGLARSGYLALVPDLPGLRLGEITRATAAATIRVALAATRRPDVARGKIAFYGVSVGASLALLAAESPKLRGRVTVVGGEAPWVDMRKIIRLATTGLYGRRRYPIDPYARLAVARSLAGGLPAGRDRTRLLGVLKQISDDDPAPLSRVGDTDLGPAGRALVALLENRRASRFDVLYARLPPSVRTGVKQLSPLLGARRLRVRVELASAPHDKYFPPEESRSLARVAPNVRVTVTTTLAHAVPKPSLRDARGLVGFDRFIVRFLEDARG